MRLPGLPARLGFAWLAACKTLASKQAKLFNIVPVAARGRARRKVRRERAKRCHKSCDGDAAHRSALRSLTK